MRWLALVQIPLPSTEVARCDSLTKQQSVVTLAHSDRITPQDWEAVGHCESASESTNENKRNMAGVGLALRGGGRAGDGDPGFALRFVQGSRWAILGFSLPGEISGCAGR